MRDSTYDCLALFSGGLDSILAYKLLQIQGLQVLGLHFISPFYGRPASLDHWMSTFGIDIFPVDISQPFVDMLVHGPHWGFGRHLNPCIDCKILMLRQAKDLLEHFQARFIVSGEVLGQRPMSQRRDALQIVQREARVKDLLIRPLSARLLAPTPMEESGFVDRTKLCGISGRGRKLQLALAHDFQLPEIPTPSGGCLLTDPESVKRFCPLLKYILTPSINDFQLSKIGRQFWSDGHWLVIGRNKTDNAKLLELVQAHDIIFKLADIPGPLAIGRQFKTPWSQNMIQEAAHFMLSFSTKVRESPQPIRVRVGQAKMTVQELELTRISDCHSTIWQDPSSLECRPSINGS